MLQKRTKIIATVGPSLLSVSDISRAIKSGVNVLRINLSHGTRDEHAFLIKNIRLAENRTGLSCGILLDLTGPKLRVHVPGGNVIIHKGDKLVIRFGNGAGFDAPNASRSGGHGVNVTTYSAAGGISIGDVTLSHGSSMGNALNITDPKVLRLIKTGDNVLINDGKVKLRVTKKEPTYIVAKVLAGDLIEDNKGFNLPNVEKFPGGLSEKDKADILFGIENGADIFALSFVTGPQDAANVRNFMKAEGVTVPIFAKIEKPQAVKKIDAIIDAFDGVMIARGDLAVEMPFDKVPILQKRILSLCYLKSKPAIVATQILETMIEHDQPTRAEISDIANAIYDRTDALMLSGETAIGKYPLKAIQTMVRVINETERHVGDPDRDLTALKTISSASHALAHTVNSLVKDIGAKAIAVWTESGHTARLLSKEYPKVPIFAFTSDMRILRQMSLLRGVEARYLKFSKVTETMIQMIDKELGGSKHLKKGDIAILVGGMPIAARQPANFIKYHVVGNSRATDQ